MPATAEAADAATQATDAFSTKLEENKLSEGQERGPDEEEDDDDDDGDDDDDEDEDGGGGRRRKRCWY